MVESNVAHEQAMQRKDMEEYYAVIGRDQASEDAMERRGQILAPIMVGMFCTVAALFAYWQMPALAIWAFGLTAAGVIGVSVWAKYYNLKVDQLATKEESEREGAQLPSGKHDRPD